MSARWIDAVVRAATMAPVVRAVVIEARGSTPREVGAWMLISREQSEGTIGGGALEQACMARAREMLCRCDGALWLRGVERFHLGPELNQCCGGAVAILLERFGAVEAAVLAMAQDVDALAVRPITAGVSIIFVQTGHVGLQLRDGQQWFAEPVGEQHTRLYIYGAGHVGCALVRALEGLPFAITWRDGERDGCGGTPSLVTRLAVGPGLRRDDEKGEIVVGAAAMAEQAREAPAGAFHLVMTHSHALDEEIVAAVLGTGRFGYLGLIGSATKRARFRQRLMRAGMAEALIAKVHCPIGLPGLAGKVPAVIAASVAADLLLRRQKQIDQGAAVQ